MKFQNYVRNEYGKCDLPSNTIGKIKDGFRKLNLNVEYSPFRVSNNIYWGQIWIDSIRIVCNGKGITPELAEASAYAELAERFSAGLFYPVFEERVRFNIPALYNKETTRFLNYEWLPGYVNAHQDELKDSTLTIEDLLANESHLTGTDIEHIKNSRMARHWVDGFSILREKTIKVPVNFVTYIHASNGMAAGNTMEEAMIQASCEIFERHVQIQIIKPEKIVPSIDPDSVDNVVIKDMIKFYQGKNVDIIIKDFSLGGVLPCIGVLFINHNLSPDRLEHRILIPGVSFNMDEGLTRCFTESMQGRETLLAPRPQLDKPLVHRSRVNNYYLLMKCCISPKDISFLEQGEMGAYRNTKTKDVFSEIEGLKRICKQFNTDCILLNHTHPVLNFPVIRVIIPKISDFLPFLSQDILVSEATRPSATWRGQRFRKIMQSFFA
ncbi:MAG: ribosomal protein S12 methylthiotransferase accessory factor [Desulfobacteraceae bacterium Eth-SRB2]|nr:MAG: ribosomal protein S12 methylthiotransferase accessory factor [Desulfobacteraceae bacterium Eth-SRB2]